MSDYELLRLVEEDTVAVALWACLRWRSTSRWRPFRRRFLRRVFDQQCAEGKRIHALLTTLPTQQEEN